MTCPHCAKRPIQPNGVTCGNSHCQEANFHAHVAKRSRGKKKEYHLNRQRMSEMWAARWP